MAESNGPSAMDLLDEIAKVGTICQETLDKVEVDFELWQPIRKESIALLKVVADEIDEDNHEANKGCIGTKSVAIGSGFLALGGIGLATWTGGISLALTAFATTVSVTSGAGGYGAKMGFTIHKHHQLEATERKLREDEVATQHLQDSLHLLEDNIETIKKISLKIRRRREIKAEAKQSVDNDDSNKVFEEVSEAAAAIEEYIRQVITNKIVPITPEKASKLKVALKAIFRLPNTYMVLRKASHLHAKALSSMASGSLAVSGMITSALSTAKTGAVTGKALAAGGAALIGISVAIDVFELAATCVEMAKGSKVEEAKKLRETCELLQEEKTDFDKAYEEFKKKTQ